MALNKIRALITSVSLAGITFIASTSSAGTIGGQQTIGFQGLVATFCNISASSGTLGVRVDRGMMTSDTSDNSASFIGSRSQGSVSVSSNIPNGGNVIIDTPTLSGGTAPTSSLLSIGGTWQASHTIALTNGTATTPVNVKFTTTNNNSQFANGT
jgi:hypothetical protein